MKQNYQQLTKWFLVVVFFIYIFQYIYSNIQPLLIFHAQQPPFLLNKVFFMQYTDYPGGIGEYLGNLFSQTLNHPFWGSLYLTVILFILTLLTRLALKWSKLTEGGFFWMFIPIIPALMLFQNYLFPQYVIIKFLLAVTFLCLYFKIAQNALLKYSLLIIFSIILYYAAGSTAFLIFLSSITIHSLLYPADTIKTKSIRIFLVLLLTITPLIGFEKIFNISKQRIWFDMVNDLPVAIRFVPDKQLYILIVSIPFLFFILSLYQLIEVKIWKKIENHYSFFNQLTNQLTVYRNWISWATIVVGAVIIYFSFQTYAFNKIDQHKKNLIAVDYYTSRGEWHKAIEIATSDKQYDIFMNYNFNRCIYNAGQFGNRFFDYPQLLGSDGLFPDKIASGQIAMQASDFYYELGYISEALHWAYEAQSSMPYSPRVLKRLVLLHLIENRPQAAATYLNVLKNAFFQKDFIKKYEPYINDSSLRNSDKEFIEKRSFMPRNFYTPGSASKRFELLIKVNDSNYRAIEYLAMHYMLSHQLGNLLKMIDLILKIHNGKLPVLYQQALLLYYAKTRDETVIKYPIDKTIVEDTNYFLKTLSKAQNKELAKMALSDSYGRSYMFYITYQSPVVTKAQLKAREVDNY